MTSDKTLKDTHTSLIQNEKQFELLFKSHFSKLCFFCQYKYALEEQVAKEIVQSSFIKLWQCREGFFNNEMIQSWLYATVSHGALDFLKHKKVEKAYELHIKEESSESNFINEFHQLDIKELNAAINNAISELPAQMQLVFRLSRFEGLKYSEIAQKLNLSVKTIETQMSRALAKLREKLRDYLTLLLLLILKFFFD